MRSSVVAALALVACRDQRAPAAEPDATPPMPSSTAFSVPPLPQGSDAGHEPGLAPQGNRSGGGVVDSGLHAECNVSATPPNVPMADADRVVDALRPRFRAIYENALQRSPTINGSVELFVQVADNGEVDDVSPRSATLPPDVVARMKTTMRLAQFTAPGKRAWMTVKIVCKRADE